MKAIVLPSRGDAVNVLATLGRWFLGAVYVWMGLNKALHPVDFLKLTRQYELVQSFFLLNSIAAVLPWFEIVCGLLLILGIAVRGTALISLLMLVPFTLVVFQRALKMHAGQAIPFCALKFDCGCGAGEIYVCHKLLENLALMAITMWLLLGSRQKLCLRYSVAGLPN